MGDAVRVTDDAGVRTMTLCRAGEYNTITPQLRDELADAIGSAQHANTVIVLSRIDCVCELISKLWVDGVVLARTAQCHGSHASIISYPNGIPHNSPSAELLRRR